MKEKIYLYLLAFITVIFLFFYKYQSSVYDKQKEEIIALENKMKVLEKSKQVLDTKLSEAAYFSLNKNESALSYIEEVYHIRPDSLAQRIENYFFNKNGIEDNPLVPYSGMNGTMKINKVKMLNHKWLMADFTDGTYWGEMLVEYFYTPEDENIEVVLLNSFLYTTH